MARPEGVHCAYTTETGVPELQDSFVGTPRVAIFTSELSALRHATAEGWKYVYWPYGQTLAEAITAAGAEKAGKALGKGIGTLAANRGKVIAGVSAGISAALPGKDAAE